MRRGFVLILGAALASAGAALAHHPFASQYDGDAPVIVYGQIVRVEWVDPHVRIHLRRYEETAARDWIMEVAPPRNMRLGGMDEETLTPGLRVTVRGYQALDKRCDPACVGNGRDIAFDDGTRLFLGNTSTQQQAEGAAFRRKRAEGKIKPVTAR